MTVTNTLCLCREAGKKIENFEGQACQTQPGKTTINKTKGKHL